MSKDQAVAAFVAYLDEIDALRGSERYAALIDFARSPNFSAAGMLLEDRQGTLHREAYLVLKAEIDKETPARAWANANSPVDRRTICKHLRIDPDDLFAFFATFPFRILRTEGERPWIAAAIGCQRVLDPQEREWRHLDINDVILWNPRTNEVQLAGDRSPTLVMSADYDDGRFTIYADGFAFFRDWADRRAQMAMSIRMAQQTRDQIIPREPVDNCMPGALVIGDINKVRWPELNARVLVAGPGIDADALNRAVFRAARLPRIETSHQRLAA